MYSVCKQEQRPKCLFPRRGESLIQNDFSLWIQRLMSFPHHRDRLLIWEEYWCFQFAFFLSSLSRSLIVLRQNSSPPSSPELFLGKRIIVIRFDIKYLHILHMVQPEAEGLLSVGFPHAQNGVLINPGHICRSGALPLSVDNVITQSVGGQAGSEGRASPAS